VTGFLFLRVVSGLRRFQGVGATAPILLLFRRKTLRMLPPILRTSSGCLHFFLQPLLGGIKGKLADTFHNSVKQVVDVHGRRLLSFG
jgi:hypothetical protein